MPGVSPEKYSPRQSTQPAVIASGADTSAAVQLYGMHLVSVWRPASTGFTTLKFDISADGTTWYRVRDKSNNDYTLTVNSAAAAQYIDNLAAFAGATFVRAVADANAGAGGVSLVFALSAL